MLGSAKSMVPYRLTEERSVAYHAMRAERLTLAAA
jgi:hypothetical protein